MARSIGTFTGTATASSLGMKGDFTVAIGGTFVGTVLLERTFDGIIFYVVETFTAPDNKNGIAAGSTQVAGQSDPGQPLYRLRCSAYTSGTITFFLGD